MAADFKIWMSGQANPEIEIPGTTASTLTPAGDPQALSMPDSRWDLYLVRLGKAFVLHGDGPNRPVHDLLKRHQNITFNIPAPACASSARRSSPIKLTRTARHASHGPEELLKEIAEASPSKVKLEAAIPSFTAPPAG